MLLWHARRRLLREAVLIINEVRWQAHNKRSRRLRRRLLRVQLTFLQLWAYIAQQIELWTPAFERLKTGSHRLLGLFLNGRFSLRACAVSCPVCSPQLPVVCLCWRSSKKNFPGYSALRNPLELLGCVGSLDTLSTGGNMARVYVVTAVFYVSEREPKGRWRKSRD